LLSRLFGKRKRECAIRRAKQPELLRRKKSRCFQRDARRACLTPRASGTVTDLQQDKQNQRAVLIGPCAHTIRDKDLSEGNKKTRGMTVPEDGARYQPVAWWFTKRRLGRELRNLYQAAEELPPRLLALVRKLEGKPDTPLEAKGEGGGSARHQ